MNEEIRNHEIPDKELEQVSGGVFTVLPGVMSPNGEQKSKELSDDALESVAGGQKVWVMVNPFYSFE